MQETEAAASQHTIRTAEGHVGLAPGAGALGSRLAGRWLAGQGRSRGGWRPEVWARPPASSPAVAWALVVAGWSPIASGGWGTPS